jgi:hypothetical protein
LGRFINRDPIEEQGGLNLYAFVRNNGVNTWDYLGMDPPTYTYVNGTVNADGTPDFNVYWIDQNGNRGIDYGNTMYSRRAWPIGPSYGIRDGFDASGIISSIATSRLIADAVLSAEIEDLKNDMAAKRASEGQPAPAPSANLGNLNAQPTAPNSGFTIGELSGDALQRQLDADMWGGGMLASRTPRGLPPPRGPREVRLDGGIWSLSRPPAGSGNLGPAPADLTIGPPSGSALVRAVGTPGRSPTVRILDSLTALRDLFNTLANGGTRAPGSQFERYTFPDGSAVQWRPFSSPQSGGQPTIDFRMPNGENWKVHIPPPPPPSNPPPG